MEKLKRESIYLFVEKNARDIFPDTRCVTDPIWKMLGQRSCYATPNKVRRGVLRTRRGTRRAHSCVHGLLPFHLDS